MAALILVSCGKKPADPTAAAPGDAIQASVAPVGVPPGAAAPTTRNADGSQDLDVNKYAEQLKRDPALYERQKAICHNAGPEANPRELGGVCAAFDTARTDLDHDKTDQEYSVTNKDSL
jgi:hypothetical protein